MKLLSVYYFKHCFDFDKDVLRIKIGDLLGMIVEKDELQKLGWK